MKRKLFLYIIAFVIVSISIAEYYLRTAFFEQLKTQVYPLIYNPDSLGGYKYIPFAKNIHISPSYNISEKINQIVNSHGYFGPDFNNLKGKDTFRIAMAGYSFNSGSGISVPLQNYFIENNKKVEVINCSVDGSEQNWQMYKRIKYEIIKYNVDLVLFETSLPFQRRDYTKECYRSYILEYASGSQKSRNYCITRIDRLYKFKF